MIQNSVSFLKIVEILIISASLFLIIFGVTTAVRVESEGRRHNQAMEQVLTGVQKILNSRQACIIGEVKK